jgi:hypothetical protein
MTFKSKSRRGLMFKSRHLMMIRSRSRSRSCLIVDNLRAWKVTRVKLNKTRVEYKPNPIKSLMNNSRSRMLVKRDIIRNGREAGHTG